MAITLEKITEIDDSIFDSLYADCVDDLGAGSMRFPDGLDADGKKTYMKNAIKEDFNTHIILFKKDGVDVLIASGKIQDYAFYVDADHTKEKKSFTDIFIWNNAVIGKYDNSKDWLKTTEFYQAMKTYLLSIGAKGMMIDAEKGKSVAVHFKQSQADGIPLGTYTLNDNSGTSTMVWVY